MERERSQQNDFARLVPWWSVALAIITFVGLQAAIHLVVVPRDPNPKPFAWVAFWAFLSGIFFAFYMLVIGYVSRDAKRRGMNRALWVVILIALAASGVGFIIYFLLREPVIQNCPQCSARVQAEYNFCPSCQFQIHPICRSCQHPVSSLDTFCANCGMELDQAHTLTATR